MNSGDIFVEAPEHSNSDEDDSGRETDDERRHSKLLQSVDALDSRKKRRVQRSEPSAQISEFNLSQVGKEKLQLSELLSSLKDSSSHIALKKQLRKITNNRVLPVPLAKPEAERVKRAVAYEKVTKEVEKWETVVQNNRTAEHLEFPLKQPDLRLQSTEKFVKKFDLQTPLEMEVAKLLSGSENTLTDDKVLTPAEERALKAMSLEEAKERLAELRKVRVLLSYKEARARRQNKIKSKGYHRILKKDRLRKNLKEFEELKKTDPEMAIDRLKEIDKRRIEERMTLKHKNTGKWAKQRMLRAKYDEKSREALIEQLEISRQLRQKVQVVSDSDDDQPPVTVAEIEEENEQEPMADHLPLTSYNPWMKSSSGNKGSEETTSDIPMCKPSTEKHEKRPLPLQKKANVESVAESVENRNGQDFPKTKSTSCDTVITLESDAETDDLDCSIIASVVVPKAEPESPTKDNNTEVEASDNLTTFSTSKKLVNGGSLRKQTKAIDQLRKSALKASSEDERNTDDDIEEFNKSMKEQQAIENDEDGASEPEEEQYLMETTRNENSEGDLREVQRVKKKRKDTKKVTAKPEKEADVQIDPTKFVMVKTKKLKTRLPDLADAGDEGIDDEEDETYQMTIAEAFADDDVLDEFKAEKKRVIDEDGPKDVDLFLPGWGYWGGQGIKVSQRKRKRFVMKGPAAPPRKDQPLGNVIINEKKDEKIAQHQVSELPFPFQSVREFESSIRQPLGNTWNPETAFRQLIVPKVTTRMGAIIDPIDGDALKTHKKPKSKDKVKKRKTSGSGKWDVTLKL